MAVAPKQTPRAYCPDLAIQLSGEQSSLLLHSPAERCAAVAFPPGTPLPADDEGVLEELGNQGFVLVIRSAPLPNGNASYYLNCMTMASVGQNWAAPTLFAKSVPCCRLTEAQLRQFAHNPPKLLDYVACLCKVWSPQDQLPFTWPCTEVAARADVNQLLVVLKYLVEHSPWSNTFYPPEKIVVANAYAGLAEKFSCYSQVQLQMCLSQNLVTAMQVRPYAANQYSQGQGIYAI